MVGARYTGLTHLLAPLLRGQGAILMLHRVGRPINKSGINDFLSVDGGFLNALLGDLKKSGIFFVSMDEVVDRIKSGYRDEHFATVTLDDGYRDNLLTAAPIFQKHNVPYTIYACPGFSSGTAVLWWEVLAQIIDKQKRILFATASGMQSLDCSTPAKKKSAYHALTEYLYTDVDEHTQRQFTLDLAHTYNVDALAYSRHAVMNWSELRKAASDPLCTIGAHTLNHFHLARLSPQEALYECEQSADVLKVELGSKPIHFAYPYGGKLAVGKREVEIAKDAGFSSAVTTRHGLIQARHKNHLHALPRISINGNYQNVDYVKTMLSGITVPFANYGKTTITV